LSKSLNKKKITVLGAGIAGLSAGYKLSNSGHNIEIYEAENYVGGLAASIKYKDCIFDFGPHTFHSSNKDILELFLDLMGDEILTLKKKVKIKFRDKLYDYPLKPVNMLLNLEKKLLIESALSFLAVPFSRQSRKENKTLEELYVGLYGKKLYNIFFENYTEKVWGYHPSGLSNSFLKHRLPNKNLIQLLFQSFKEELGLHKSKLTDSNYVIYQYYPKKGSIRFAERLKENIVNQAGKVLLQTPVSGIHVENNNVREITVKRNGNEETVSCDLCISTIPLTELVDFISPQVPEEIIEASKTLKYRAVIIVCLVVDIDQVIDTDTLYFHHQIFNRMGQMNSYSKETTPPGKSAITIEITCFPQDAVWEMDETTLVESILEGLKKEGFDIKDRIEGFTVLRSKYGYPVPVIGYERSLEKIFRYLNNIPNLYVSGRQGLFTYIQMFQAMEMGFKVAADFMSRQTKSSIDISLEESYPQFI